MEVTEAYIPKDSGSDYLLQLINVHVPSGPRPPKEHHHIQFELMICKSGSGTYMAEKGAYPILPGDVFVFSSHENHYISVIDPAPEGIHMMDVKFEPRYLWGSRYDSLSGEHLHFCFAHAPDFPNRLPPDHPATRRIRDLMLQIEEEFDGCKTEYALMVRSKVIEIVILLLRELGYADTSQAPLQRQRLALIRTAVDYVSSHLQEKILLSDVAQAVSVTPNYLSNLFHKTMGISLWDYLTEKRVQRAMSLLDTHPHKNVLDIALSCGFNSTASFNKAFREYTGCTPSEYRKNGGMYYV